MDQKNNFMGKLKLVKKKFLWRDKCNISTLSVPYNLITFVLHKLTICLVTVLSANQKVV